MARRLTVVTAGLTAVLLGVAAPAPASVFRIANPTPAADAAFGTAIAGLGDLNGDGVPDFAVGAPGSDRVDVISGADRTVIRSLHDPQSLPGLNFGFAVLGIGDVNGDGVEDIAVGAPGPLGGVLPLPCDPSIDTCPRPEWGRVFLFSGASGALIRTIVPSSPEFLVFGFALAAVGDVTGDGVPDLVVGSPVLLPNRWGEVYAFSGATGSQLWRFQEPPHPTGVQAIPSLGQFLASVGDVNGDGKRDVLAAAPFHDNDPGAGTLLGGRVFVLSGVSGAVIRSHQAATPIDNGFFGGTVSAIGDQDGDGVEDYLIGHRGASEILLVSGATGAVIRSVPAPASTTQTLLTFARAGDRDGDGREDVWVGVPGSGAVSLVNGHGTVLAQVSDPGGAPAKALDGFGRSLAALGDVNGDGTREVVVGKPGDPVSGQAGAGAVFLVTSNRPPIANAGPDAGVAADASCAGTVTLNGAGSSDPDGDTLTYTWTGPFGTATGASPTVTLGLGQHTITLVVDDGHGATATDTVVVTVTDRSAPVISGATASTSTVWPPNHTMHPVTIGVVAADNCDAAPMCRITGVTSSEPQNGRGDGNTAPDTAITGALTFSARAERAGGGVGRTYTTVVACEDFSGNRSSTSVLVTVPKSRGQ
jgi:K319L-like, PKD domain/FG-GAP repeat